MGLVTFILKLRSLQQPSLSARDWTGVMHTHLLLDIPYSLNVSSLIKRL
jgi:hypothetical protein